MKLLVDEFKGYDSSDVISTITEAKENTPKKYYIEGVFAQADVKNRNGRSYPKKVMEKAINEYNKLVEAKRAVGEMMHPSHPNVNLERVSHLIESLKWDGNNVIGRAKIMTEMPMGKIAKGLIDEGVKIGVSTRGLGTLVEKGGVNMVQDDFVMTAVDIVGDPSAPDAFVEGIMEGAEWIYDLTTNSWRLAEVIKEEVKRINSKDLEEAKLRLFEQFLNNIR